MERRFLLARKKKAETATVRTQELLRKEATKKKGGECRKGRNKESGKKGGGKNEKYTDEMVGKD